MKTKISKSGRLLKYDDLRKILFELSSNNNEEITNNFIQIFQLVLSPLFDSFLNQKIIPVLKNQQLELLVELLMRSKSGDGDLSTSNSNPDYALINCVRESLPRINISAVYQVNKRVCPHCESKKIRVITSSAANSKGPAKIRKYMCRDCSEKWVSAEVFFKTLK